MLSLFNLKDAVAFRTRHRWFKPTVHTCAFVLLNLFLKSHKPVRIMFMIPFCKHVLAKVILVPCSVNVTHTMGQCWSREGDNLQCSHCSPYSTYFRYTDSTVPLLLKFQASSSFLCFYRPVCVGLVRKPHCLFSHEAAQL